METTLRKKSDGPPSLRGGGIGCPVERIAGIWQFRLPPYQRNNTRSTPGHLIHLLTAGTYHLRTDGRDYDLTPGDLVYYYECEEVEYRGDATPVSFYSVSFFASGLKPPRLEGRVLRASGEVRELFSELYACSNLLELPGVSFRAFANLLQILDYIAVKQQAMGSGNGLGTHDMWRELEERARLSRQFRPTLDELASWRGCSRSTVVRACRESTGESPMQRIRSLRMEEACGLLTYSSLTITQVAEYLGYARIHEFSREFSRCHGVSPSEYRSGRQRT